MEISKQLVCECNGKLYKTAATLKAHRISGIHMLWELPKQIKDLEIRATRAENENAHLKRLNFILIDNIQELKEKK